MAVPKKNAPFSKISAKISLVIPCYNEEQRIPQMVIGLQEFVRKGIVDYEIIVVDDGSVDGTAAALQAIEFIGSQQEAGKLS
ncbi:MAG: glycosyltransferase, partial [Chitinophagales bacterium]